MSNKLWTPFVLELVQSYCKEINSQTFTMQGLQKNRQEEIKNFSQTNNHPFDKVRQQLQLLREDNKNSISRKR